MKGVFVHECPLLQDDQKNMFVELFLITSRGSFDTIIIPVYPWNVYENGCVCTA